MPAPPSDTPDTLARAFVADLAAHRFDDAARRFDPAMVEAMPTVVLAELWRKLEDASGAFQAVEDAVEIAPEGGFQVARVTCRFAYRRKVLRVVLGQDLRVSGLFYGPVPRELEDQARALVDRLSRTDFVGATTSFDAIMKAALPPDKLGVVWKQVERRSGAFAEVRKVELVPASGLWTVLLTSRFAKAEVVVKVVYDVRDQVAGLFFLPGDALAPWKGPPYAKPDALVERDVSVGSAPALPGVLTLPKGTGPFPVVVLVHGSGPGDMDESIGPNKPFKDIAWGLGARGIAVLRYVKRTRHAPAGVVSIKEEVLDGAAAAIDLALHRPELDPKRVVVVGHSQGGYLAPRIAAENAAVAGIVLLAGPSRPLQDSVVDQFVYLTKIDPSLPDGARLVAAARAFKAAVEDPALAPDASVDFPGGGAEKGRYFLSLRGYDPDRRRPEAHDPHPRAARASATTRSPRTTSPAGRRRSGEGAERHPEAVPGAQPPLHRRRGPAPPGRVRGARARGRGRGRRPRGLRHPPALNALRRPALVRTAGADREASMTTAAPAASPPPAALPLRRGYNPLARRVEERHGFPVLPGGFPLLGHLPAIAIDELGLLRDAERRLGSLFYVSFGFGNYQLVHMGKDAMALFRNKGADSSYMREGGGVTDVFGQSVLVHDGPVHHHLRSAMNGPFQPRGLAEARVGEIVAELVDRCVRRWSGRTGVRVLADTRELALEVMFRLVGVDDAEIAAWRVHYEDLLLLLASTSPSASPARPHDRGRKARAWLDERLRGVLARAREGGRARACSRASSGAATRTASPSRSGSSSTTCASSSSPGTRPRRPRWPGWWPTSPSAPTPGAASATRRAPRPRSPDRPASSASSPTPRRSSARPCACTRPSPTTPAPPSPILRSAGAG